MNLEMKKTTNVLVSKFIIRLVKSGLSDKLSSIWIDLVTTKNKKFKLKPNIEKSN